MYKLTSTWSMAAVIALGSTSAYAGQGLGFYELEPNETCATGTPFSTGSGLGGGQLSSGTDLDFFRYTSAGVSALALAVQPADPGYNGTVLKTWIRRADGTILAGRRVGSDSPLRTLRAAVSPGTYCVLFERVPGYSVMTKEYRLQVSEDTSPAAIAAIEVEPNDTLAQATALQPQGPARVAQLHSDSDLDFLSIAVAAGQDVTVLVDVEERAYDGTTLLAELVDSNGAVLAGRKINSDQASARMLMARRKSAGPVFLSLRKRENYTVMEKYSIASATVSSSSGLVETEPNNSQGAEPVHGPGTLWGQLLSRDDIDGFAVPLMPGVAEIRIEPENTAYDGGVIVLDVRGPGGTLLASREVTSDGGQQIVNVGVAAEGTHFLTVRAKAGFQHFDKYYRLTIPAGRRIFATGFEF